MKRKMKQFIGILLFVTLLSGLSSCYNTSIDKPAKLIKKDKFVKMMVDIYLVQGVHIDQKVDSIHKKLTQTDLYYSVLKKYDVPDTIFIRSLIYYSSFPKEYEKMHVQVMDILKEAELQYKPKEKLDAGEK
jgi:hypothetical protein